MAFSQATTLKRCAAQIQWRRNSNNWLKNTVATTQKLQ